MKTEIYKPDTIQEAINDLQIFLESDLPSHFFDEKINNQEWIREDKIKNEEELLQYLKQHFGILKEQVKELENEKISISHKTNNNRSRERERSMGEI